MFFFRIPVYMNDGNLRLRRLKMSDHTVVLKELKDETVLRAGGISSCLLAWWIIRKTFIAAYCIENDSKPIGFIGLYDLIPGKSAYVSMLIFDENDRRMGHGTRAFKVLALTLKRIHLVEKLDVKVDGKNHASISFWTRLGFKHTRGDKVWQVMSMDLIGPARLPHL